MGNPLGIIVVIISVGEATVFEIVYIVLLPISTSQRFDHIKIVFAAGLATSANMIILLNILLGQGLPLQLILLMLIFSFISGIILGGYLGFIIFQLFQQSGLLDWRKELERPDDSFSRREPPE